MNPQGHLFTDENIGQFQSQRVNIRLYIEMLFEENYHQKTKQQS